MEIDFACSNCTTQGKAPIEKLLDENASYFLYRVYCPGCGEPLKVRKYRKRVHAH